MTAIADACTVRCDYGTCGGHACGGCCGCLGPCTRAYEESLATAAGAEGEAMSEQSTEDLTQDDVGEVAGRPAHRALQPETD